MNIEHFYIHKNSPRENALIERSFRTDEDKFFLLLERGADDINALDAWLQTHLVTYNAVRPHMGIKMLTPKEFINLYNKSY
ncbi:MAG: transposase [Chloroflexi bacterium]|nr:transposase [Chloroflexota bacterium]